MQASPTLYVPAAIVIVTPVFASTIVAAVAIAAGTVLPPSSEIVHCDVPSTPAFVIVTTMR